MENVWPCAPWQNETLESRGETEKEMSAPKKWAETVQDGQRWPGGWERKREKESVGAEVTKEPGKDSPQALTFKEVSDCKTPLFTCQIVKTKEILSDNIQCWQGSNSEKALLYISSKNFLWK